MVILDRVVREGLSEEVTAEHRTERSGGASHWVAFQTQGSSELMMEYIINIFFYKITGI